VTHGDEDLTLQVSQFLLRERWAFGGGHGLPRDPDWSANIISEVRFVRSTRSAEELLAVRDEREYPQAAAEVDELDEDLQRPHPSSDAWWHRLARWAIEHYWGAVAAGLTVLIIGALFAWGASKLSGGSDDPATSSEARTESTETSTQSTIEPTTAPGISEEAGEEGARTYRNPFTLAQTGPRISPFQRVRVGCRVHAPTMPSVTPDGNWYKILTSPWSGRYYAPANSFWNGDIPGQTPYTHSTDFKVPRCTS
jgi:hypothetical protein